MFTPKQERNGAAVGVSGENTAVPGPDATAEIGGLMSESQHATDSFQSAGSELMSGVPGVTAGIPTAGGNFWDWDSGLAIAEQPGEA